MAMQIVATNGRHQSATMEQSNHTDDRLSDFSLPFELYL